MNIDIQIHALFMYFKKDIFVFAEHFLQYSLIHYKLKVLLSYPVTLNSTETLASMKLSSTLEISHTDEAILLGGECLCSI